MSAELSRRKILYVGDLNPGGTCAFRFSALQRLGQDVTPFDPARYLPKSSLPRKILYRYPVGPLIFRANRELLQTVKKTNPDIVWFDKPLLFTPSTIKEIRASGALTVCYNQDNPFGPRNDGCWLQFMRVYRLFDLHCLFRTADIPRYSAWELPFIKILLSYEPSVHFPPSSGWTDAQRTREVSFVGSPYDDRPKFLLALGEEYGLPLSLAGPNWSRALDYGISPEVLNKYLTGGSLNGPAYREAIWKSKINLAFVTHSNEEDVGHKSFEITACRSFLLAERTPGHMEVFEEDKEAVFFSSVEECADKCRFYLANPEARETIAQRGHERAVKSGYDNDSQLKKVLLKLDGKEHLVEASSI
jgi:spore maturation protein CgeB